MAALAPGSAAASISLMTTFWTPGYLLGAPLAGILIELTGAAVASFIVPYRAARFHATGVGALATFADQFLKISTRHKVIKEALIGNTSLFCEVV